MTVIGSVLHGMRLFFNQLINVCVEFLNPSTLDNENATFLWMSQSHNLGTQSHSPEHLKPQHKTFLSDTETVKYSEKSTAQLYKH